MDISQSIRVLIESYHELNAAVVDELTSAPSALEFHRFVAKNRPFVIRNGASEWTAVRRWNASYLRDVMNGRKVQVAITPKGNADSVVTLPNGELIYVEPHVIDENFDDFLKYIQDDQKPAIEPQKPRSVKYGQTQNDNLRQEYQRLFSDVPSSISFVDEALEQQPDAINFWLGNDRSVTALHKDNYENVYVQVRGKKHFVLLPPVEMPCTNEAPIPRGHFQPVHPGDDTSGLTIAIDGNAEQYPVPLWDPDDAENRASRYSQYSQATRVTLNEGDMLYLPAMWYHKVSQSCGAEGFVCSVNYWYDMDFSGGFWAQNSFVRDVTQAASKSVLYPELSSMTQDSTDGRV